MRSPYHVKPHSALKEVNADEQGALLATPSCFNAHLCHIHPDLGLHRKNNCQIHGARILSVFDALPIRTSYGHLAHLCGRGRHLCRSVVARQIRAHLQLQKNTQASDWRSALALAYSLPTRVKRDLPGASRMTLGKGFIWQAVATSHWVTA